MATGRPLFPSIDQNEHLQLFRIMLGDLPDQLIARSPLRDEFYDQDRRLKPSANSRIGNKGAPKSFPLKVAIFSEYDPEFIDFIGRCLVYRPDQRMTPEQALEHRWVKRTAI